MNKPNEKISFAYTSEFGETTELSYSSETDYDMGIMFIARAVNLFLKALTYDMGKDYVFLESITEEEYEELTDYLEEIRAEKTEEDEVD